jgi:hypothetical protein
MLDRNAFELTESIEEAERLFIEDFDTWDMTGYYLYSKYWRAGVSRHIGTGGLRISRATLYQRIRERRITIQKDGRRSFITAAELQRYVNESQ